MFWFFLELLSFWQQHEHAAPVFDSAAAAAAVTNHRAQQFVNKSKHLPWGYRAALFVFKPLCSVPCSWVVLLSFKHLPSLLLWSFTLPATSTEAHRWDENVNQTPLIDWLDPPPLPPPHPLAPLCSPTQSSVPALLTTEGKRNGCDLKGKSPNWGFRFMLREGQGAVSPYSYVLEEAVSGTKQLTVVAAVMQQTGMCFFLNYR